MPNDRTLNDGEVVVVSSTFTELMLSYANAIQSLYPW